MIYCSKLLHILQQQSCILQTRTESPKPCIVQGRWWSVKCFPALNFRAGWRKSEDARRFSLWRASMVATYYIKLFRTGADKHNGISISLHLLVAETIVKNSLQQSIYFEVPLISGKLSSFWRDIAIIKQICTLYVILNLLSYKMI